MLPWSLLLQIHVQIGAKLTTRTVTINPKRNIGLEILESVNILNILIHTVNNTSGPSDSYVNPAGDVPNVCGHYQQPKEIFQQL